MSRPCRTEAKVDAGWPKADQPFVQVSYQEVRETLPTVAGAEYVNDDEICMTCHEAYVKSFANNVHRQGKCESCHGPASKHVEGRGKEPGLIFSFKQGSPAARAEACLRCHEENQCAVGCRWRTSQARPLQRDLRRLPPRTLQRAAGDARDNRSGRCGPAGELGGEVDQLPHDRQRPGGGPGQGGTPFAPRHVAPPRRDRPGHLLSLPLRQDRLAADRRPAPNLRTQRLQLHDLPRPARTNQGVVAAATCA